MRTGAILFGLAVSLGLAGQGWAAEDAASQIGRLSAMAGPVQYHPPAGDWSGALVNEPVAAGAGMRTGQGAEAEWRLSGARIALAPASDMRVQRLDGGVLQIVLDSGRIGLHLDADAAKTVEIDLSQGGVWLAAPGDYDISAGDAHEAAVIQVFAGAARTGGGLDSSHIRLAEGDAFSGWWRSQDDNADLTDPRQGPRVAGLDALAAAGRWEVDDKFGNVWFPSDVGADWAPYRDGTWRYLAPWGWTWVDNADWGFAPSHYGRWARIDGRWGWVPGSELGTAGYTPAAVAFLGTAGIGLSRPGDIGAAPAVAWFPLAPGEKLGAAGDADGAYRNRRFATAVPRNIFAGGLPVAGALVDDLPPRRFIDALVILQSLNIPPGAAPAKPPAVRVAAAPPVTPEAVSEPRPPYLVALRDPPPPAPVRVVKKRLAILFVVRPRHLASALHSPHTRQHLAAARGGA